MGFYGHTFPILMESLTPQAGCWAGRKNGLCRIPLELLFPKKMKIIPGQAASLNLPQSASSQTLPLKGLRR
ncbi:hypothetical protein ADN00_07735 [Ornatilinea apprima]|uniref:Uncharacterized protein n=1 Tax=Ornatilinea apprima TaxID=1134406 RepID=A0A0P6X8B6_9CHLR|nr:hypothetical protein ADN00_07735 [Ornatilinea apprima]